MPRIRTTWVVAMIAVYALIMALSVGAAGNDAESAPLVFQSAQTAQPDAPSSRDALFNDPAVPPKGPQAAAGWTGYIQGEVARQYKDPEHWSKARLRGEASRQGQFNENVKWKISGRADYDAVYDFSGFYPPDVKRDQRYEFTLRENYLDVSAGNLEVRLGRQHVVWGEMVGLFVADVVSARDLREFILPEPELEMLRIPQWAARAEYFMNDVKAELLWIPLPSFNNIGKPGADFFPYPIPGPGGSVSTD